MNSRKELKTGIFVITTLIAVVLTVNYLRGNGFLENSRTFYTSFTQVNGLNPATPVYINGYKAGAVTSMKYDRKVNKFCIKLNISGDFDIPEDSHTEIFSSDILGGKSIRIILGESQNTVSSGYELPGLIAEDPLNTIMAGIPSIMENADTVVANLKTTVKEINKVLCAENINNISQLINSLRTSAEHIQSITGGIDSKTPEISDIISHLKELSLTLNNASLQLETTLSNTQDITGKLAEADLKGTIENINSLVIKLQDPNGSLGKIMSTDSLHNSINSLMIDIDSLVNKIKENPRKNLKLSVF